MLDKRNTHLDGWRAFAVLGVMWHHWVPARWRGPFPFEIGLFFFLTLTGFLITRILIRERRAFEIKGGGWRWKTYLDFQKRRMARILIPCYVAMFFALAVGARDIRHHPFAYFGQWSNFHMAVMEGWPAGTAHYWTLAIQVQFYIFWPLFIFWIPRRLLALAVCLVIALAPFSRWILYAYFPQIIHSQAITITAMDYLGVGSLLALAMEKGMVVGNIYLKSIAWISFACYILLYVFNYLNWPQEGFSYLQQTFLAISLAGLISSSLQGFKGLLGRVLDHSFLQVVGRLSYSLYLYHTVSPLLLGYIFPWLWNPFFAGPWLGIRILVFALTSWVLSYLSWRYVETIGVSKENRLFVKIP